MRSNKRKSDARGQMLKPWMEYGRREKERGGVTHLYGLSDGRDNDSLAEGVGDLGVRYNDNQQCISKD